MQKQREALFQIINKKILKAQGFLEFHSLHLMHFQQDLIREYEHTYFNK